jgi:predicted membrane-bound spermidine synthase
MRTGATPEVAPVLRSELGNFAGLSYSGGMKETSAIRASPGSSSTWWIAPAFFVSGFAALIYQVVWQRVLFASFGINIEAVTIVVTAFLAGLGLGSIVGGALSTRGSALLLLGFSIVELSIGAFGLVSVSLFRWTAGFASGMSHEATGVLTFLLVLIPTLMMGVTLPLLVAFMVRENGNVGSAVGQLYFVNTAGSALASMAAALFLMRALGESGSVALAGSLNIAVAAFVMLQWFVRVRRI